MSLKQRLELTWIGKYEHPDLEPRILIEDGSLSYGNKNNSNLLIHGDNLLALKALEQDFSGKIKCIYIDPPFNTGVAFQHYDDSLEHSIWLDLMAKRLRLLHKLLAEDGAIFVHIDYNEEAYLRVLMDEIFGRNNFRNTMIVSRVKKNVRERELVKALNFAHDVIVFYAKSEQCMIKPPLKESKKDDRWHGFEAAGIRKGMDYELFGFKPSVGNHWRWTLERTKKAIEEKKLRPNPRSGKPEYFIEASEFEVMDSNWMDVIASSFSWRFPNGEKNERLIQRVIEMVTEPGDVVLDSFLGSGTTAAVAHKMGRRWVGIEMGEHCLTHCVPRLKSVVDGKDQGGISVAQDWKGGGGFKYYELAPSLLRKDDFGNWVIEEQYKPDMLAAAMAKHEGFKYCPDQHIYWKHGQSTERDFIYTTTNFLTVQMLDKIHDEMKHSESLLICCKSFSKPCDGKYPNITVKKIPNMLLGRCEFGKKDYSLNIVSMPVDDDEPEFVPAGPNVSKEKPKGKKVNPQPDLFSAKKRK